MSSALYIASASYRALHMVRARAAKGTVPVAILTVAQECELREQGWIVDGSCTGCIALTAAGSAELARLEAA
jgi:hypothetical protein